MASHVVPALFPPPVSLLHLSPQRGDSEGTTESSGRGSVALRSRRLAGSHVSVIPAAGGTRLEPRDLQKGRRND